jgi:hypothetical protein
MSISTEARAAVDTESNPATIPPISGVVSGMRPAAGDTPELRPAAGDRLLSGPALASVLIWLAALTMLAVDTMRADFSVSLVIAAIQAALIVAFFMRLGWDSKLHLFLVGIGALLVMLLLLVISVDRSEYQPELNHWGSAVGGRPG